MSIQWSLVLFSLIAGAGGATLAYAGIGEFTKLSSKDRFRLVAAGLVLLVVGGICSVFHLKSPMNFMSAITHLGSFSGISIELMLIGALIVCGVVFLIGVMRDAAGLSKAFGVICLVLGVVFAFMLGSSYLIEARAGWNTVLVPLCYLASSIALGGFIAVALSREIADQKKTFGIVALVAAAAAAIFALAYGAIAMGYATSEGVAYFVIAAAGGVVAAVSAYMVAFKQKTGVWVWVGLAGALVCGLFIRMFMWTAGSNMFDAFDLAINNRARFMP